MRRDVIKAKSSSPLEQILLEAIDEFPLIKDYEVWWDKDSNF